VRVLHPLQILRNETGPIHREIIDHLIKGFNTACTFDYPIHVTPR
jgi:hypothetical protein